MLAATVQHDATSEAVKVRNLSASGALVEGDKLPGMGASVTFGRSNLLLKGHVVWVDGRRSGVRFEQLVNPHASLRHVTRPRPVTTMRTARPGLACKPLSDSEKRMMEQWATAGLSAFGY
jgi:hypothetical protein